MYVNFVYIYILIFLCVCAYTFDEKKTEKTRAMWRLPFPPPQTAHATGWSHARMVCVFGDGGTGRQIEFSCLRSGRVYIN